MAKKQVTSHFKEPAGRPNFIKQWRKYRGLRQYQLAERIGRSTATISQLENRKQPYTQETLEAISDALMCDPADLLMRNPLDTEAPWSIWEKARPAEKQKIIGMMRLIVDEDRGSGTDG